MPSKISKAEAFASASGGGVESSECLSSLTGYSCELSNTLFDSSNKVKVEIIPQVDNDVYSSANYGDLKSNVVEMWSSSPTEDVVASSSGAIFRPIKSEDAEAVANLESAEGKSSSAGDYGGVIRHSSDDFGANNSSFDKYISVHVKEEVCKEGGDEYDSEDTKSAASLTFREEDEDKLIIDEETMEVKQIVNLRGGDSVKPS